MKGIAKLRTSLLVWFTITQVLALTITQGMALTITQGIAPTITQGMALTLVLPDASAAGAPRRAQLLVQASGPAALRQAERQAVALGGRITYRLPVIQAFAVELPAERAARLAASPAVARLIPDGPVFAPAGKSEDKTGQEGLGKRSIPVTDYPHLVGADRLWAEGITGRGVTVAVLDTGLSPKHIELQTAPDGAPHLLAAVDLLGAGAGDPNGHGTHVAGIVANRAFTPTGAYAGVAPGANLVSVRVLGEDGAGTYASVIAGIQWVLDHQAEYGIRVLNLSLYAPARSRYWEDPLNQAVMRAWQAGIVVVAAAGNGGPGPLTVSVPGNNPYVITVGAYTDHYTPTDPADDDLASFSAAGPTFDGFVKPDLLAPGGHIVSTMHESTRIAREHPEYKLDAHYFQMSGTSMSAAVVSGAAALLLERNPALTNDEVKYRLMVSARPFCGPDQDGDGACSPAEWTYSPWQQGAGMVDAYAAASGAWAGSANGELDLAADLDGRLHYAGPTQLTPDGGSLSLAEPGSWVWNGRTWVWNGAEVWSGRTWVWNGSLEANGRTWVWNGSREANGRTWVWNGSLEFNGRTWVWNGSLEVNGRTWVWNGSREANGLTWVWNGTWVGEGNAAVQGGRPRAVRTPPGRASVGDWVPQE